MDINIDNISDEDLKAIEDKVLDELIEKARVDFYTFVKLMAPTILPEEFIDGVHLKLICDQLQEVMESVSDVDKDPLRQQIFLPPGGMKSKISSNLFPAYCLGHHPNWCFLAIGADFEFAVDNLGRPTKELIDSDRYKAIFPGTVLKKDVKSAGRWHTTKKGVFVAKGAGQGIAGRRAHITICDDVINEQTNDSGRQEINGWYRKGLRSRLLPRGAEVIINTRWFTEDLSGFMLKIDEKSKRPWRVISIPALLDEESSTLLRKGLPETDKRFAVGTSFWPELWPTDNFLERKETTPPAEWAALYMQRPVDEDGGIVKEADFQLWKDEEPPKCKDIIISMDTAFAQTETADFSAYTVWGIFSKLQDSYDGTKIAQDCMILLAAGRARWDYPELCNKVQELNGIYNPDYIIIENKASGQILIPEMRKRSLPIIPYTPEKDKAYRLHATTPYFQAGRIFVPEGKQWARDVMDEVLAFNPRLKKQRDDYTDTVSQAIIWMRDRSKIDNEGYENRWEEEQQTMQRQTYWSSMIQGNQSY